MAIMTKRRILLFGSSSFFVPVFESSDVVTVEILPSVTEEDDGKV